MLKKGDRAFHCLTGETFTVTRILSDRLGQRQILPDRGMSAAQPSLSAADVETLMSIVAIGIELGDSEVLAMLNELELETKKELWIKHLNPDQRSALSKLKAHQEERSGVAV